MVNGEVKGSDSGGARSPGNRALWILLSVSIIATSFLPLIYAGILPVGFGMVAVTIVLVTVFWLIRTHLPSILLVFVSVLLVSVVATQRLPKLRADRMQAEEGDHLSRTWKASGKFNQDLPIVLHLVFDEMMSVGAITDDLPGGAEMRRSLQKFGESHSLRMYESVYSRFYFSNDALPTMMSSEYVGRPSVAELVADQLLPTNRYFDDMARRGYRTAVFQSALINFCTNPNVDLCETFDSFDPGGGSAGLDERNQRASLWQAVIRAHQPSYTSAIGQSLLARIYGLKTNEVGVLGVSDRYDAQRFPAWFDRFTRFVANVPRGTHVFAHFMVPHSPYLLSESCVVSGRFEAGYYLAKYPAAERTEKRRAFYEGYFAQLQCVQNKLDDLMTAIDRSEKFRDAVIIIHGDHGSRISNGNILEDLTQRDFIDNYATFFAVRSPAVEPGVDCELVSLPEIFRRHIVHGGNAPPRSGGPLPVVVTTRAAGDVRVEAPMPLFGCAASASRGSQ